MNRFGILLTGCLAVAAVEIPAFVRPAPRLVWNASASIPVGLYAARPAGKLKAGDLVAAYPPAPVARLMAERGYLPLRVPMLKHVAAVPGQRVCRIDLRILIDGEPVAEARTRDREGRQLPSWQGCRTLGSHEVFLLNAASEASFDGRYFGPVSTRAIQASLTPLWLAGDASGASAASLPNAKSSSQAKTNGANDDQNR
jgi:conjugative transfer signal peptidase TraF